LRRAVLDGLHLQMTLADWAHQCAERGSLDPVTAPVGTSPSDLLQLMKAENLRHIPLIGKDGRLAGLALLSELIRGSELPLSAVVMAGGLGTRLRPLTEDLPRPMLPIGERPLIEDIVTQLREAGIRRMSITTHYKPERIKRHFGDGRKFGVEISYVNEDRPLGTAGALALMEPWKSLLLVINGDILTRVNFHSMLAFHQDNRAVMTVGVRQYGLKVPYGVVETEGVEIRRLSEKPMLRVFINAGVYLLEPRVHSYLVSGQRLDMTDLIRLLLEEGQRVISFPISEYWLDIGRPDDYENARADSEWMDRR
jgi:NDP-sugar pyrophosphorylase family protein